MVLMLMGTIMWPAKDLSSCMCEEEGLDEWESEVFPEIGVIKTGGCTVVISHALTACTCGATKIVRQGRRKRGRMCTN